jgi:hypothetical protein
LRICWIHQAADKKAAPFDAFPLQTGFEIRTAAVFAAYYQAHFGAIMNMIYRYAPWNNSFSSQGGCNACLPNLPD